MANDGTQLIPSESVIRERIAATEHELRYLRSLLKLSIKAEEGRRALESPPETTEAPKS